LFFIYVLKFGWEHQHSIKELASTSVNPMIWSQVDEGTMQSLDILAM
jgi:hypothetical protein